jgi:hypothetical protein
MCDLAEERININQLLLTALREVGEGSREDLRSAARQKLEESYVDRCPDLCIARRVDDFVAALYAPDPDAPATSGTEAAQTK